MKKAAAFAEIKFTKALAAVSDSKAGAKLYDQFNFDDPWIFRVCFDESTRRITCDPDGEVPNWVWLAKTFESAYPQLDAVTRMPRGPGR